MKTPGFRVTAVIISCSILFLSICSFSPKFHILKDERNDTFEWYRGITFREQVADPFSAQREPAMEWRLLPALICKTLGLSGNYVFIFPYLGVGLWLYATAYYTLREYQDPRLSSVCTLFAATSGGLFMSIHFFGINDGWIYVLVSVLVFSRNRWLILLAGVLGPWIDERFVIGLPLAVLSRHILNQIPHESGGRKLFVIEAASGTLLYLAARMVISMVFQDRTSGQFLSDAIDRFLNYAEYARLGWWNGWRAGWIPILGGLWYLWKIKWKNELILSLLFGLGSASLMTLLAQDMSRSLTILFPLLICLLCLIWSREDQQGLKGAFTLAAVANLVIPFSHVIDTNLWPVNDVFYELLKLTQG